MRPMGCALAITMGHILMVVARAQSIGLIVLEVCTGYVFT